MRPRSQGFVKQQWRQHQGEVPSLVRLPGLRDPVLGDHQAGKVGDRHQQCTFLFPPPLAPLHSFPSTATARRAGTWPGSARGGSQPRVRRLRTITTWR